MTLQLDLKGSSVLYNGKRIGELVHKNGKTFVQLNLKYSATQENWIYPLIHLAEGLKRIETSVKVKTATFQISTAEEDIARRYKKPQSLLEVLITRKNYNWTFHKTDPDLWPSPLHGHDYARNLKLDAVSGHVYDIGTKQRCQTLRKKTLKSIQKALRDSKDFKAKVEKFIDAKP